MLLPRAATGRETFVRNTVRYLLILIALVLACGGTDSGLDGDANPPRWPQNATLNAINIGRSGLTLTWTPATDEAGVVSYHIYQDGQRTASTASATTAYGVSGLQPSTEYAFRVEASDAAGNVSQGGPTLEVRTTDAPPPDVATMAPKLNPAIPTTPYTATRFLYEGPHAVQTGVATGVIEPHRASLIRGVVRLRDGGPLSDVAISIKDHPEFGSTLSDTQGEFNLVVNGGGHLVVRFEKEDFLPVDRRVQVAWEGYAFTDDVAMIALDDQVTTIDLLATTGIQVARGTPAKDASGERQATLFFPDGARATMILPDGSEVPLNTLDVRATEYTVGEDGPNAMPGPLPPSSAYTYAVDLTVDEALQSGAESVHFDPPVTFYVENFLEFPVGEVVPAGHYDRQKAAWLASDNGQVIEVLDIVRGEARLDLDGDGLAEDAQALRSAGIHTDELRKLASLYTPRTSLWRVAIPHFTPWDYNWPYSPPEGATAPRQRRPRVGPDEEDDCEQSGSIIECQSQVLREEIGIVGTPFSLHYKNYSAKTFRTIRIPLSSEEVPKGLVRIELEIKIAGQKFTKRFSPQPLQTYEFEWDQIDGFERLVYGRHWATIRVGYTYVPAYTPGIALARSFARYGGATEFSRSGVGAAAGASRDLSITLWQSSRIALEGRSALWTLSPRHKWVGEVLRRGDGTQQAILNTNPNTEIDGRRVSTKPLDIAVGPDGSVYLPAPSRGGETYLLYQVDLAGKESVIAGGGSVWVRGFDSTTNGSVVQGDGLQARSVRFRHMRSVAVAADGSAYLAADAALWRVWPSGLLEHIAGTVGEQRAWEPGRTPDDGPGKDVPLFTGGIDVDPEGYIYVAGGTTVQKIDPSGYVTTIAGDGVRGESGDGGPAAMARFLNAQDVSLGPDGSLYVADRFRIRRISPQGRIETIAGTGATGSADFRRVPFPQGANASSVFMNPGSIEVAQDGTVFFGNRVFVSPDGSPGAPNFRLANHIGFIRDSQVYAMSFLNELIEIPAARGDQTIAVAVKPDGTIASTGGEDDFFSFGSTAYRVVDSGGDELYVFDGLGNHVETVDAETGAVIYSFSYNSSRRLTSVQDVDGDTTTIERSENGLPILITGPYGHQTRLTNNEDGFISAITNPNGETYSFTYHDQHGLLASMSDPRGSTSYFEYDEQDRLTRDIDSAGGERVLVRSELENGYEVEFSSPEGVKTRYITKTLEDGSREKTVQNPDGTRTSVIEKPKGIREMTYADGTVATLELQQDPRFGMQAPLTKRMEVRTPSGLTSVTTAKREVELDDSDTLLKQTDTVTTNGNARQLIYDRTAQTFVTVSPEGRETTTRLDAQGRVIRVEVPGYLPVEYDYDERGRLSSTSQGDRVSQMVYDARGEIQATIDPLGREETFEYDLTSQLLKNVLPDGQEVKYQYDPAGNLTSLKPPGRPAHAFTHDSRGLSQSYVMPMVGDGAGRVEYTYNLDAQLTGVRLPDLSELENHYDAMGRLTRAVRPESETTFEYDADAGKLIGWKDSSGVDLAYTYDGPFLTDVTWTGEVSGQVRRTFNADLTLSSLTVEGGQTISYTYDRDGLMVSAGALQVRRDPANGLIVGSELGTLRTVLSTTPYGERASKTVTQGQTTLYEATLTRDLLGQIVSAAEQVQGEAQRTTYTYTANGQLETVGKGGAVQVEYAYDANGNRTLERRVLTNETITAEYDARDRMTRYGPRTYAYSPTGFLTKRTDTGSQTSTAYTYNTAGDLTHVLLPDQREIRYVIDAAHRRVGRQSTGHPFKGWLYGDQLNPIAELDADGNIVSQFIYATQQNAPDYMLKGETLYRFVTDVRGSVRLVVNTTTGEVVQSLCYSPFGQVEGDTNPGFQPFGFAGGLYDPETGLVRFGARDYDPDVGRWTAMDPLGFAAGDTSLYVYAFNDPINLIDPTGELVFVPIVAALLLAEIALSAADAISVIMDLMDPCLSTANKALSLALFAAGLALPGAGFSALKRVRRFAKKACFAAGTLIVTAQGQIPIEQISVGDTVWARNDQTGEHAWKTVTATMSAPSNKIVELTLLLPSGTPEVLRVTESHEFWTEHRWQPAKTLESGLSVWTLSGWSRVESVSSTPAPQEVYNFTVEDFHTYFAGDAAVWTHNTCIKRVTRGPLVGAGAKLENITASQARRIQNAANRSGKEIGLVGSRAKGTARPDSDWDFVIDANHKTRNNLSRSLPGGKDVKQGVQNNQDVFKGQVDTARPHIIFSPE